MKKTKILFVFGTRPEAIKLASLIKLMHEKEYFDIKVCSTGQHAEMLEQVLDFFEIVPDYNLRVMKENQSLTELTCNLTRGIGAILQNGFEPDFIIVQGDTTTAMTGALTGFYAGIPVIHVEAGLRSKNNKLPFPEELNRKIIADIADYHFAPTKTAVKNLKEEGIDEKNIWEVGNTVIDSLKFAMDKLCQHEEKSIAQRFSFLDKANRLILVTAHRRENLGIALKNICESIKTIATQKENIQVIFPMHLNPKVRDVVQNVLKDISNVFLLEPLSYPELLWVLNESTLVITDSGGIQEEAPALGKPVLILREVTERNEGIETGNAKLVGTTCEKIVSECLSILDNKEAYERMSKVQYPYGNGNAGEKIISILKETASV